MAYMYDFHDNQEVCCIFSSSYFSETVDLWIGYFCFYIICFLSFIAIFLPSLYLNLGGINPFIWLIEFISLNHNRVRLSAQQTTLLYLLHFINFTLSFLIISSRFFSCFIGPLLPCSHCLLSHGDILTLALLLPISL